MATEMEQRALGRLEAICDALRSRDIDFYPKVMVDNVPTLLTSSEIMSEFGEASSHWKNLEDNDDLDDALKLARDSLDEVKSQTEYQDQKATRLLTVTTFVSAISAALFARLADAFPFVKIMEMPWFLTITIAATYLLFGIFLMYSLFGALVTFHATRTRFKYKKDGHVSADTGPVLSRLFFQGIIKVRPSAWSADFVCRPSEGCAEEPKLNAELKARYLSDMVGETYLIACKTADKLRYLDPAQRLLATALKCLIGWIGLLALLAVLPHQNAPQPTSVKLVTSGASIGVEAKITSMPSLTIEAMPAPSHTDGTQSAAKGQRTGNAPLAEMKR